MNAADPFDHLEGKKVIVAGGAGFLGTEVVSLVRERAASTFVVRSADYDLRDPAAAVRLLQEHPAELVINCAARLGGIGANRAEPAAYFYDNLMIGVNVIEACRLAGVEKLVNIGSVCSYPKGAPVPFNEADLWNGFPEETNGPYGVSKRACIVFAQAVGQQYGLRTVNLLLTNLYGPGDDFRPETSHVIPATIRKVAEAIDANAGEIVCWGDGSPTRDFLHVRDAALGVVQAAAGVDHDRPINLASGTEVSIRQIVELIAGELDYGGSIRWDPSFPNGQPRRVLDITRARAFGFEPRVSISKGVAETVRWYSENRTTADSMRPKYAERRASDSVLR